MSDKEVPETQEPAPAWRIKDGKMYIGETDVTNVLRPRDKPPEQEDNPQPPPEPVVEGEEVKEEPVEPEAEPEPEPEKAEPEAEEEPEEEPEPVEPGPIKLDMKYKGEEYSEELTPEQIAMKLQRLRFLDETQKETFERSKEVEPYWHLVKSDWFKEQLKQAKETGEFELPPEPPSPPDEVMFEIAKRESAPDYYEILYALQQQAIQMPKRAQEIIDSNPNVFLKEFDRVAEEIRKKNAPPQKEEKKPTPKEVEKRIEIKESAKTRARVTKPGAAVEPVSPMKQWKARENELVAALRDPANRSKTVTIVAELLAHRREKPT